MPLIIFDWNRTLFDFESQALFPGVPAMLEELRSNGCTLHLLSSRKDGRQDAIDTSPIIEQFAGKTLLEKKSREAIEAIIKSYGVSESNTYVVGDVRDAEIRFGNEAGAKTIWLKKGEFADEVCVPEVVPWKTIDDIEEVLNVFK